MQTQTNQQGGTSPYIASDGTSLDPTAVTLAKSIRQVESQGNYNAKGASGEFGTGQWMPGNFEAAATKYGLNPTDKSPINQDKVLYYQIEEQLKAGHSQSQVASWWNSGKYDPTGNVGTNKQGVKYDTPGYVAQVQQAYQKFVGTPQAHAQFVNPSAPQPTGNNFVAPPAQTQITPDASTIPPEQPKSALDRVADFGKGAMDFLKSAEAPFAGVAAIPTQLLAKSLGQGDPFSKGIGGGQAPLDVTPLDLEKKAGDIAQVGSYFVPGSGVAGAIGMGTLQGAGSAMSQGKDLGTVATQGGIGAALGGGTALAAKGIGYGLQKAGEALSGEGMQKAISGIKDAYSSALNLNASERAFESRSGKDLAQVLLDHQAPLGKYENGTLDASGAISKLQEALNPLNQQADQVLQHPQGVVNNIPFQDVFDAVKSRIAKLNINPTEQKAAIKLAQQNIMDTAEKYGTEATPQIADQVKQMFQGSAFRKALTSSDQLQGNVSYLISDELRKATEKAVAGTDAGNVLGQINLQRSDLVDAIKRLTKIDGSRLLKGGKLGNMFGNLTGAVIGSQSGGLLGGLAGDYFGGKAAQFLNNPATKIGIAKFRAGALGKASGLLGKASAPIGKSVSAVGSAVSKSARPAGLLANLAAK